MMPDKIYIGHDVYNNVDKYWEENPNTDIPGKSHVEYIRKDALLKWAQSMIASDKTRGIKGGFYMLIDKLNEM